VSQSAKNVADIPMVRGWLLDLRYTVGHKYYRLSAQV
jgi:hypothetical protein